ncbi:MAG: family 10 glycosylhydrolase [Bacteroidota bacterium]
MKRTYLFVLVALFWGCKDSPNQLTRTRDLSQNPKMTFEESTRQIHLDFHTSEHIDSIGYKFDKKRFQEALKVGSVNAINVFAKGHHSWSYYPTQVGMVHPNLNFDLLKEQIAACREIGVRVFAYFTVGWSANDAKMHPEWAVLRKDGSNAYRDMVKELGPEESFNGWEYLEPSGPYAELIYRQTEELIKNYDLDGIWYDIHQPEHMNFNAWSLRDYVQRGIDPNDSTAVIQRTNEKYNEFFEKTSAIIKKHKPDATIYYNGTTRTYNTKNIELFKYGFFNHNTKHDLEDLPTAWGGYDIFPWRSKYFANTGKDIVAMSGKFHKAWGEFGGFKHKDALLYEAASMVAFGASCNIGDQLHPSGEMDRATYENIGYAFDYVEKIEDYGVGADHVSSTGLYVGEDLPAIEGIVGMLLERQVNFNVVNTLGDWSNIEVLVITSGGVLERDIPKVKKFVQDGGKVIAMGEGIFHKGKPIIDIGAEYLGKATYDVDYTVVNDGISEGLVTSPFLNYTAALRLKPNLETEVLASIREPFFSRTISHYSSHNNTPYRANEAEHPAVVRKGNVIYLAHDLDRQYSQEGARIHRDMFYNALQLFREHPMLQVEMPSMGRINLLHQPEQQRYVAHLLYASPIQRGSVRVIEDLVPLYDIPLTIDVPERITEAYLVPSGEILPFEERNGRIQLTVPRVECHTAVVLEYEANGSGAP